MGNDLVGIILLPLASCYPILYKGKELSCMYFISVTFYTQVRLDELCVCICLHVSKRQLRCSGQFHGYPIFLMKKIQ